MKLSNNCVLVTFLLAACVGATPLQTPRDAATPSEDSGLGLTDTGAMQVADASGNTAGSEAPIGSEECRPVQGVCPAPCLPVRGQWIDETHLCRNAEVLITCMRPPQGGPGIPTSPGCARRATDGARVFLTNWYHLNAPDFYGYGQCEGVNVMLMRDWPVCL